MGVISIIIVLMISSSIRLSSQICPRIIIIIRHRNIVIYRKPSSNTIAIHRNSRHPHQQKLSIFNSLIHRLTNIPITTSSYNKELKYIRTLAEDNGFDNRTINKLLHKHKSKQNTISALENQKDDTDNKWVSFTYTGNETTKLAKLFKQIDKNIHIGLKSFCSVIRCNETSL